jgi:gamma-butyrobetaine dioxygenase
VWLRANCPCADCLDPGSGQRRAAITDLPADVTVAEVLASDAAVEVIFGPDGHRAVFAVGWLARYGGPGGEAGTGAAGPGPHGQDDDRTEDAKCLWAPADLGGGIPQGGWPRYLADPEHRRACLSAVLTHGLVVLHEVPCEPGAVLAVARSLGYVRETNYGRLFDVRSEPAAANLASRAAVIPRNPYRTGPDVQLLRCLHAACKGDRPHRRLKRRGAPRAIGRVHHLTTPVTFAYSDGARSTPATRW